MATVEERQKARARAQARLRAQESIILRERENPTFAGTAVDSVAQGLSFNLSDEIESGIRGAGAFLTTPGGVGARAEGAKLAYGESQDTLEARRIAGAREFPKTSFLGSMAGGGASGIKLANKLSPALSRVGMGAPMSQLTGIGAIESGLFGLGGAGEGDRLSGLGTGALLGAGGAPLGAMGIHLTGSALRPVVGRVNDAFFGTPANRGVREVLAALEADEITPQQAAAAMRRMGAGATIADAGGDATLRLGRTAYNEAGAGASRTKRFLDQRQNTAQQSLVSAARRATASNSFDRGVIDIIEGAETAAKPYYDEAYRQILDVTPRLMSVLKRPAMVRARGKARQILENEGWSGDIIDDITDVRYMDAIKRALDNEIGKAVRSGARNDVRVLTSLKKEFTDIIDAQVPAYAQARATFSGEESIKEAAEFGRTVFKQNGRMSSDLVDHIRGLSGDELTAARAGFLDFLQEEIAKTSVRRNTVANKFAEIPRYRTLTQALFPDQNAVNQFLNRAAAVGEFSRTKNFVTGNSSTANKMLDEAAMNPGVLATAVDAATNPAGAIAAALRLVRGNSKLTPEVRDEIAKILFDPNIVPTSLRQSLPSRLLQVPSLGNTNRSGLAAGLVGSQISSLSPYLDPLKGLLGN